MTSLTRQLYLFLAACGGHWRNTIFVTSRREPGHPGYLLAADHDGCPVIIKATDFQSVFRGHVCTVLETVTGLTSVNLPYPQNRFSHDNFLAVENLGEYQSGQTDQKTQQPR